jgi:hypothetical protein
MRAKFKGGLKRYVRVFWAKRRKKILPLVWVLTQELIFFLASSACSRKSTSWGSVE